MVEMNKVLLPGHLFGQVRSPLVDPLVTALLQGNSALVTGSEGTASVLDAAAPFLFANGVRVLRVHPPHDLTSFMQQVALPAKSDPAERANKNLLRGAFESLTVTDATCERIVLLVEDAHLMPEATLGYIETAFRAGPHLSVAFAGQAELAGNFTAKGLIALRKRLSLHLVLPLWQEAVPLPAIDRDESRSRGGLVADAQVASAATPGVTMRAGETGMEQNGGLKPAEDRGRGDEHPRSSRMEWAWGTVLGVALLGIIAVAVLRPVSFSGKPGTVEAPIAAATPAVPALAPVPAVTPTDPAASTAPLEPDSVPQNLDQPGGSSLFIKATANSAVFEPALIGFPASAFRMGSTDSSMEQPVHAVTLAPFYLAQTSTTVREWQKCVEAKACTLVAKGQPDEPVVNVSWEDALQYVSWLSKATMRAYRLPTEAEWEYAARAGKTTRYAWGNTMLRGKTSCKNCGGVISYSRPPWTDAYPPNAFGFYGMGGGVAEWVADCWHRDYRGAPSDGSTAWDAPDCRLRVLRGGSWQQEASSLRVSSRENYDASVRYPTHGFRVARSN